MIWGVVEVLRHEGKWEKGMVDLCHKVHERAGSGQKIRTTIRDGKKKGKEKKTQEEMTEDKRRDE